MYRVQEQPSVPSPLAQPLINSSTIQTADLILDFLTLLPRFRRAG